MSPKQFLLIRRMQMVRRELRLATPATTTVTEVITRYGFWNFGRFAGIYKAQYGERPSVTRGRPPE